MGWLERKIYGDPQQPPAPPPPPPPPVQIHQMGDYGLGGRGRMAHPSYNNATANAVTTYSDDPYADFVPSPDPSKMSEVWPLWKWRGNPRGGARDTAQLGNCPNCHGTRYFSRVGPDGSGRVTRSDGVTMDPAPECFECGYPRNQGSLGVPAGSGGALPARQAESAPPQGSIAHLRRS